MASLAVLDCYLIAQSFLIPDSLFRNLPVRAAMVQERSGLSQASMSFLSGTAESQERLP